MSGPEAPEGSQGGLCNWAPRAETYPVQAGVGNLETQDDDSNESQDERLVSVHHALWPYEGDWHLWAQLAGARELATSRRVLGSVLAHRVPKGEAGRYKARQAKALPLVEAWPLAHLGEAPAR